MSEIGRRKAAMLLATLAPSDRRALLSRLPASAAKELGPLLDQLRACGDTGRAAVEKVLENELRGLTADTTLDIEQMLSLARRLPPEWYARVLVASGPIDHDFMLAMLDDSYAASVRAALREVPVLPPGLAGALLEEAMRMADREVECVE